MDEQREQTIGEKRVRLGFNPSNESAVDNAKVVTSTLINASESLKNVSDDPEVKRLCALASTAYEEGAMWLVKALTAGK